jgi:hypothetical protein
LGVGAGITGFSLSLKRSDTSVASQEFLAGWLLAFVGVCLVRAKEIGGWLVKPFYVIKRELSS